MLVRLFETVVEITLATSVVIALLLLLSKLLEKKFAAKWRYWVWLIIAIRLILPFNLSLASPPVQVPTTEIVNLLTAAALTQQTNFQDISSESLAELNDRRLTDTALATDLLHSSDFQLADILWMIWIAGASAFLIWQLLSYGLFLRRVKADSRAVSRTDVLRVYGDLCKKMKIKQQIPLMTSPLISSPMVLGIWKQQLFLPDVAFTPIDLEMILRHELIHVRRQDIRFKILILLTRAIHWFNPLIHLMAIEANKAVEISCDAAVVANQNIDFRKNYSRAILSIIKNDRSSQVVFSSHFGGGKMMIMKRLENLFDMRIKKKGVVPFIVVILIIGLIGLCVSCRPTTTTTPTTTPTTTSKAAATSTTPTEAAAENDPKLLGKWVEEIPADIVGLPLDSIEFLTNGLTMIADKYQGTYKIVSGKLQVTVNTEVYTGKYEISGTKLTIFKDSGESKSYLKTEVVSNDPKLLGKWVEEIPADIVGLPLDSIEFLADGRTRIADQYQGTYRIVNGKLQVTINGEVYTGKYEISDTKLTIFKDNGESKSYLKK